MGFKGDRDYVHGTDVFNAVQAQAESNASEAFVSSLLFRRFARRDCDLFDARPEDASTLVAQGTIRRGTQDKRFWVAESDRSALGRQRYDESAITRDAEIDGVQIRCALRSSYTPIEEIIALTKRLVYFLAPKIDGKWVFGQLALTARLPDDYAVIVIKQNNLLANRFSANDIQIDGNTFGEIRFIVARP